ncbi:hypothetical protein HAX54_008247, partial [Datura stramonium]|nr:hypothetical protein [Datura stramonium]
MDATDRTTIVRLVLMAQSTMIKDAKRGQLSEVHITTANYDSSVILQVVLNTRTEGHSEMITCRSQTTTKSHDLWYLITSRSTQ